MNLGYQSYLNHVFHRTRLARVGHAACMPVIVTALLALLYPVHATLPGALALAAWWAYWAVKERDPVWGGCAVGLAAALCPLALALGRLGAAEPSPLAQPWAWLLLACALQAGSHILEPLPPRVTRSVHWIPPGEYLLGRAGHRNPPGTAARRAGQLTAQAVFGTVEKSSPHPGCCRCSCWNCSGYSGTTRCGRGLADPFRPGDRERQPRAGLHRHRRPHAAARPGLTARPVS